MAAQYLPRTLMLLGSGELGKEVAIAAQRLGCRVIAVDRYPGAPAMQVSDQAEVIAMTDPEALKAVVRRHRPDLVIPEIEALAVDALAEVEAEGITVIPTARATAMTMNRDRIRDLAAGKLGLRTARFAYAESAEELVAVAAPLGWPVVVKPVMSSSGKGQSVVRSEEGLAAAWQAALDGARGAGSRVIVEEFLPFELEITLLTVRPWSGPTLFCPPIGHLQERGDYQCSWQPAAMGEAQLAAAQAMALAVTDELGGAGLFGVEFFLCGEPGREEVVFSELSPRPHDTGLVTLMGQNLSEFELHLRAVLGLPIPAIRSSSNAASRVILADKTLDSVAYTGVADALAEPGTQVLLFGKPNARPNRRMGVALATGADVAEARARADRAAERITVVAPG
ncbi:formate-dependent phosphoribosylglycinamide formyltransferase [Synechococcus sp. Cruz-9H2]|uniref:formate-dependent phosphoribosylglycinamide formyltransferase n=1 Tax=unclassified Synechococcus TaxID=2626047 RepID=UPI0020CBA353|nr:MULTISPECIES: formate-dependent phosphoribosylglycinamide formyltransferase [unclassified Synechococcus]MCP9819554.1 formate-dependent phosphoribosylglycinamide formyltransferase [Synechococcus sp. Cruz-9H2]MCP9843858.1 formate-dependent phosphoribosylglycinamide formyltransferase [Synechococcus sp. Edmonson 11F2]MCP9855784.1 formate-dependent phosphoribosylglycinamide formyltransferase [Synechococcus sp. Cruz-9C9]MCP9863268.1 formate-dependent phosphoribosylglycinamide formyltransferase [Sy